MARGKRSLDSDWDRLFDELYLKTYAVQRDEEAEALAIGAMRLADCEPGADALDAACGYGRHSRVLAKAGYRTVGLDRSSVLLDEARRRWEGADPPRWLQGDYRELPFQAGTFDAVVNLFTSFGFFSEEDDLQALTKFRRVLRPGRALVLEAIHRDRLMAIFREQDWEQLPHDAILLERRSFDSVNGICEVATPAEGRRRQTSREAANRGSNLTSDASSFDGLRLRSIDSEPTVGRGIERA